MLSQIENMISGYAKEAVSKSKDIPSDKGNAVSSAATGSIMDFVKKAASSNDLSSLTKIFGSDSGIQDAVSQVSGGFVEKLIGQGFNSNNAKGIAASLLPMILSQLTGKANSKNGILDMLGGKGGDIGSILSGLTGGDKGKSKGGGLMGKMKDLLG